MNCPECGGTMKHKWSQDPDGKDISVWTCVDCFHRITRQRKKNRPHNPIKSAMLGRSKLPSANHHNGCITCRLCGKRHRLEYADAVKEDGTGVIPTDICYYRCGRKIYIHTVKTEKDDA